MMGKFFLGISSGASTSFIYKIIGYKYSKLCEYA